MWIPVPKKELPGRSQSFAQNSSCLKWTSCIRPPGGDQYIAFMLKYIAERYDTKTWPPSGGLPVNLPNGNFIISKWNRFNQLFICLCFVFFILCWVKISGVGVGWLFRPANVWRWKSKAHSPRGAINLRPPCISVCHHREGGFQDLVPFLHKRWTWCSQDVD